MYRWYLRNWKETEWWIRFLTNAGTYLRYEVDLRSTTAHPYTIMTTSYHAELTRGAKMTRTKTWGRKQFNQVYWPKVFETLIKMKVPDNKE